MLTTTTALYAGSDYHVINIVLNIIPTLYEGYIVSVHRMVRLWKIVLLTLAASRGTDLHPS